MCPFIILISISRFLWPAIDCITPSINSDCLAGPGYYSYWNIMSLTWTSASSFQFLGGELWIISSDVRGLEVTKKNFFWGGEALKIKFQRFFEYRKFKQECQETVLEMNAHLFFFFQENVEEGECSCKDCKTPFHKRFISNDRGRLLSGTLINASFSPLL